MLRLVTALLLVSPDAGAASLDEAGAISLARSNCFDADGGVSVHRIGACVVTCLGEDSTAVLVDGGSCPVARIKVGLTEVGDFWGPGERPAERNRKRK